MATYDPRRISPEGYDAVKAVDDRIRRRRQRHAQDAIPDAPSAVQSETPPTTSVTHGQSESYHHTPGMLDVLQRETKDFDESMRLAVHTECIYIFRINIDYGDIIATERLLRLCDETTDDVKLRAYRIVATCFMLRALRMTT